MPRDMQQAIGMERVMTINNLATGIGIGAHVIRSQQADTRCFVVVLGKTQVSCVQARL